MTTLDLFVIGVLAISAVLGLMRGIIHELFSLGAWVFAFLFTKSLAPFLAPLIPGIESAATRHLAAILLVFILILVLAIMSGTILAGMVKWVGLGFYDKFMGLVFGTLRGGVIVLLFT
ncbi:MAG: CvpA family protein, partial [Thiobacillaceae bacterium]